MDSNDRVGLQNAQLCTSSVSYLTRQSAFAVAAGHDLFLEFLERDCFNAQEAFPDVAFAGTHCHRFMLAASTPPSSKQCQGANALSFSVRGFISWLGRLLLAMLLASTSVQDLAADTSSSAPYQMMLQQHVPGLQVALFGMGTPMGCSSCCWLAALLPHVAC